MQSNFKLLMDMLKTFVIKVEYYKKGSFGSNLVVLKPGICSKTGVSNSH